MVDLKIKSTGIEPGKPSVSGNAVSPVQRPAGSFSESVTSARKSILDGELRQMLDQTRKLGDVFLRSPDEPKLEKYKQAIREYLGRASKEMFSLKQETGDAREGRQKVYQLVETVNKEVDTLTRETLQKDQALNLLASLDEIRGLVLDLIT